jgi:hypothetical protein
MTGKGNYGAKEKPKTKKHKNGRNKDHVRH